MELKSGYPRHLSDFSKTLKSRVAIETQPKSYLLGIKKPKEKVNRSLRLICRPRSSHWISHQWSCYLFSSWTDGSTDPQSSRTALRPQIVWDSMPISRGQTHTGDFLVVGRQTGECLDSISHSFSFQSPWNDPYWLFCPLDIGELTRHPRIYGGLSNSMDSAYCNAGFHHYHPHRRQRMRYTRFWNGYLSLC